MPHRFHFSHVANLGGACVSVLALLLLSACSSLPDNPKFRGPAQAIDGTRHAQHSMLIAKRTYDAVDNLLEKSQVAVDRSKPILVASIVSVNNLEESSALGRLMTEQISGRIVQLGYTTIEPKLRNSLAVQGVGELILSRDVKLLKSSYTAQAVVSGTYAVGVDQVHLNLKLIELTDGRILSAVDYVLPVSEWTQPDTKALLGK
jgi:TolB-like protein